MKIFDPHIHMYARTTDDYERMALSGISRIVEPSFWLGNPRVHAETFFDYFNHMIHYETDRARGYGIDHYVTVSMNPREANDPEMARRVVGGLVEFLKDHRVVGIGEIGFDSITPAEEECLVVQLELARKWKLPVLVHTPHREKPRGTERILHLVRDLGYNPEMVLIDHNTEETIAMVRESGCWAGHTVYPVTKLSPERAVNILENFGTDRMLVNSSADWGHSDPLSVPKTVQEMRRRGFSEEKIQQVVWDNPNRFFGQSGRIKT